MACNRATLLVLIQFSFLFILYFGNFSKKDTQDNFIGGDIKTMSGQIEHWKTHKYGIVKCYECSDGQIISVISTVDFKAPIPKWF